MLVSPRAYGGNLPLKIFDYLAAGRPIVATDIPTHRTVLTEERAVLVAPRTDALAEGILAVLGDPARAGAWRTAARSYAQTHFGWSRFVDSVEAALRGGGAACQRRPSLSVDGPPDVRLGRHPGPQRRPDDRAPDPRRAGAGAGRAGRSRSSLVDDGSTDDTVGGGAGGGRARPRARAPRPAAAIRRWPGTAAPAPPPAIRSSSSTPTACPAPGWLARLLAGHEAGAAVVGGSLDLPAGLAADGPLRLLLRLVPRPLALARPARCPTTRPAT